MRRLLKRALLMPLLLLGASAAYAYDIEADVGHRAIADFNQHILNAREFQKVGDTEMFCKELIAANLQITTWFSYMQKADPELDLFKARAQSKQSVENCNANGFYY